MFSKFSQKKGLFSFGSNTEPMKHFYGTTSVGKRASDYFFRFELFRPFLCGFKPFKESIMGKLYNVSSWRWNPELFFPFPTVSCVVQMCSLLPAPPNPQAGNGDPSQTLHLTVPVLVTLRKWFPSAQTFLFLIEWLCFQLLVWDLWPQY